MEPTLFGILFNITGWIGMGALVILSVAKGWLVPRFTVDKWLEIKDGQLSDIRLQRDDYRTSASSANESIRLLSEGQRELIQETRLTSQTVQSLRTILETRSAA